jgi:hypothetical protein
MRRVYTRPESPDECLRTFQGFEFHCDTFHVHNPACGCLLLRDIN